MATIELTQDTGLAPDAAWRAWTTDEGMQEWWWPHLPDTNYRFRPTVEKYWEIFSDRGGLRVGGEFTAVQEPTRLAFTWRWVDGDRFGDPEPVTVTLEPSGAGTRCTVSHECADDDAEALAQGWRACLERFGDLG